MVVRSDLDYTMVEGTMPGQNPRPEWSDTHWARAATAPLPLARDIQDAERTTHLASRVRFPLNTYGVR